MRDRLATILRLSVYAVVLLGYLSLAMVQFYGVLACFPPLLMFALAPLGEWLERAVPAYRTVRVAACIIYVCFIPVTLASFGLVNAVILLVVFIQFYLMMGRKDEKSYYQLILMAFFLLLAAVVQQPSPGIAPVLAGFIVGVIWAFTTLRIQVERDCTAGARQPDMALLNGLRVRGGGMASNVFDVGLVLSLILLSIAAMGLTIVLFLVTPRVEAGLFSREDDTRAVTGLSEKVTLGGGMSIFEDQSAVMHVAFPDEPGGAFVPARQLYWRASTLSRFSGAEWSRHGLGDHYQPGVAPLMKGSSREMAFAQGKEVERSQRSAARHVRQVIFMDNVPTQALPCLDLVQKVRMLSEDRQMTLQWDWGMDFMVQLNTRGPRRVSYETISEIAETKPEVLRRASWDYSELPARDRSLLTYQELLPATREQVNQVVADKKSPYDIMVALNDWLSSPSFHYTLELPPLPPDHPVDHFITATRRGHCELFASALALMARSCNIPARVVSGYRGGDFSPSDRSYTVRASMAHLWVEAYFSGIGWVRFDPSPQSALNTTGLNRVKLAWSRQLLRGKMFWYQDVMGFQGGWRLDRLFRWKSAGIHNPLSAGSDVLQSGQELQQLFKPYSLERWAVLFGGLVVMGGLLFLWRRWRSPKTWRPQLTASQRRAVRLYLRLIRRLERGGLSCSRLTAEEILGRAAVQPGLDHVLVQEIIGTYNAARFGAMTLDKQQYRALSKRSIRVKG